MSDLPSASFSEARRFAWLRLWRSENVGPRTFQSLLSRFGTAEAALDALPGLIRRAGPGRSIRVAAESDIAAEFEAARRNGARFLCRDESDYPSLLREIDSAPAVIAVRGRLAALSRPAVAIVGSRNASAAGLAFAERLARELAQAGYTIVSGFARGIDSRAHRASVSEGTVAVLAGGHDRLYPAGQDEFMERILEQGAAVSEMPFGWEARGRDFPRRNRLVSGLSLGTVIVEAARRSGSLITARFAADQGRDVFAVPGSPLDPRAEGTNDLLRDGAIFCTGAEDVLRALADRGPKTIQGNMFSEAECRDEAPLWDELDLFEGKPVKAATMAPITYPRSEDDLEPQADQPVDGRPVVERVAEHLGPAPVSLDELARTIDVSVQDVRGALLRLEIDGRIERHGAGLVSLIPR